MSFFSSVAELSGSLYSSMAEQARELNHTMGADQLTIGDDDLYLEDEELQEVMRSVAAFRTNMKELITSSRSLAVNLRGVHKAHQRYDECLECSKMFKPIESEGVDIAKSMEQISAMLSSEEERSPETPVGIAEIYADLSADVEKSFSATVETLSSSYQAAKLTYLHNKRQLIERNKEGVFDKKTQEYNETMTASHEEWRNLSLNLKGAAERWLRDSTHKVTVAQGKADVILAYNSLTDAIRALFPQTNNATEVQDDEDVLSTSIQKAMANLETKAAHSRLQLR
ncbi:hypothetical protein CYMTET_53131 [Cymbomonas tetramitiformis]|uniref:Uncharacterized protein n=1 Tax=Cymbomonas tetramitiformis TaxID=36881 RepID=A0AAE0BIR6_9CHLO|nr:hypothetical protein CYMTET_53131 [Cymbomonas tetramitiformis]